ncbi:hypothetical protein BJX61DRAFT_547575 [Aspergillus egyptiacus]|nr:hypothetical protein BJX61DRAFT_547575 [Aspergillus egyptiacus]
MVPTQEATPPPTFGLATEREFYRYLPRDHSAYPFAPFDEKSQKTHVAIPSQDHVLTSFAQLGALRLAAERAIISLFGPTDQYILTEATGATASGADGLRLGCCILPRQHGICTEIRNLPLLEPSEDPAIVGGSALVIPDMQDRPDINQQSLDRGVLKSRFCAGVPIISPRKKTIGSYCVFDSNPRPAMLDNPSIGFMKDMAATVMKYLDMMQSKLENERAKKMIYGLGSFVEGKATLRDSWIESQEQEAKTARSGEMAEGQLNKKQQDIEEARKNQPPTRELPHRPPRTEPSQRHGSSGHIADKSNTDIKSPASITGGETEGKKPKAIFHGSDPQGQDKLPGESFPAAFQKIFSRAANLIRESLEVEGVAFLDGRVGSFGGLVGYEYREGRESTTGSGRAERESSPESTESGSGESMASAMVQDTHHPGDDPVTCRTLASSTSQFSTINNDPEPESMPSQEYPIRESVIKSILNRYPHGKIFNFNEMGILSDDSSSDSSSTSSWSTGKRTRKKDQKRDADELNRALGGARSIILLPLWDSHKSRWLCGILVWTKSPQRVFTAESELVYLHAFGNSVMAAVHRLDVEMDERAKTNLVTSISHELRSPLHGILGTADILSDTALNALQQGMVHTIEACGRTLLDTISNLLDFTYIDKFRQDSKSKRKHGLLSRQPKDPSHYRPDLLRSPPSSSENACADVQLDAALEEVVESVFAGHSFYHHFRAEPRKASNAFAKSVALPPKKVTIIFEIQEAGEWNFHTQAGCWRRILMNVFNNALKYTSEGFIYLGLKVAELPHQEGQDRTGCSDSNAQYVVSLTVKDTGQGIGTEFLRDGIFNAFAQEDALAPGSGLGLSIVRKAVASLNGSIEVSSEKGRGTEVSIQVPMRPSSVSEGSDGSSSTASYSLVRSQAQDKTIGIVGFSSSLESERDITLFNALKRMCEDWFHFRVEMVSLEGGIARCDFYLMVHVDLDNPDTESNKLLNLNQPKTISPLIVICQSPQTAHNMFAHTMSQGRDSIVEFISQPCGPRKLAKALQLCIRRMEGRELDLTEETRWVEVPESSRLPIDIGPRDAPYDRMKISKRPNEPDEDQKMLLGGSGSKNTNSPVSSAPERSPVSTRPSILLVEDNPINLGILVANTKKEGWDCVTAQNGLEAVQKFQAHRGEFRMVILDISMPVMNGFDASRRIREFERTHFNAHPSAKPIWLPTTIVALTGLDSADAQQEAFASGVDTFLTKPVSRQELRSLLRQYAA